MATARPIQSESDTHLAVVDLAFYAKFLAEYLSHDDTHDFNLGRGYRIAREGLVRKRLLRSARSIEPREYERRIPLRTLLRLRETASRHVQHVKAFRSHTGPLPQAAE